MPPPRTPTPGSSPLARGTPISFNADRSYEQVHPRWRGEHPDHPGRPPTSCGSSPLARGTPRSWWKRCPISRFIPAGAGNTFSPAPLTPAKTVHPRWRGEHGIGGDVVGHVGGSSPLARGTQVAGLFALGDLRFIPAGAGNTSSGARNDGSPSGSSPLARGTQRNPCDGLGGDRFIPAGAGNTPSPIARAMHTAVHPRWRGEHAPTSRLPCTRQRFIPAGAGNTAMRAAPSSASTVHPRWRGEHFAAALASATARGSSPLARGTPTWTHSHPAESRFIPAGAGNTSAMACSTTRPAVHPRWRGEH